MINLSKVRHYIKKLLLKYEKENISKLLSIKLWYIHTIRRILPKKEDSVEVRGIQIESNDRCKKMFDESLKIDRAFSDEHKKVNCDAIKEYVEEGDRTTIIGGGYGLTTVAAAREVEEGGSVVVYEGSKEMVEYLKEAVKLNGVQKTTTIRHAIVETEVDLKRPSNGSNRIAAREIKECDVMELDCEGSELDIIDGLSRLPKKIIVETHPKKGADTSDVRKALGRKNYKIINEKKENSGKVLVAELLSQSHQIE